jgi:hypothetical protein
LGARIRRAVLSIDTLLHRVGFVRILN